MAEQEGRIAAERIAAAGRELERQQLAGLGAGERAVRAVIAALGLEDMAAPRGVQMPPAPNQADDAFEEMERLRAELIERGWTIDMRWPLATLREKAAQAKGQG